jgi:hypothetical protein
MRKMPLITARTHEQREQWSLDLVKMSKVDVSEMRTDETYHEDDVSKLTE